MQGALVCVCYKHTHTINVNTYVFKCIYVRCIIYMKLRKCSVLLSGTAIPKPTFDLPHLSPARSFCFLLCALALPLPQHSLRVGITKHPLSQPREGPEDGREEEESKSGLQHPAWWSGAHSELGGSRPKGPPGTLAKSDLESGVGSRVSCRKKLPSKSRVESRPGPGLRTGYGPTGHGPAKGPGIPQHAST